MGASLLSSGLVWPPWSASASLAEAAEERELRALDRPCQVLLEGVVSEWSDTRSTRPCEACSGFRRTRDWATLSLRRAGFWGKAHLPPEVEPLAEVALEAISLAVQPVVPRPCGSPPVWRTCPVPGRTQWPRVRTHGPV